MQHGKGLVRHDEQETGIPFSLRVAGVAPFDWSSIKPKNVYATGKSQGSSSSCTSQATGYGVFRFVGDISRQDEYANTKLPGGGAYLVSPPQWLNDHGYVLLSSRPDPNPENEADMSAPTGASDSQRTKIPVNIQVFNSPSIDEVAQAILDHDVAIIGISYSTQGFATSWTNPTYQNTFTGQEGHALHCVNPVVLPNGKHAIDCQSSWWGANGPDGISTHHEIDDTFFANGGAFELLTVDVINKGNNMQLIKTPDGTVYMETPAGCSGIADEATLAALFGGEPIVDVASLPSPEIYTISQGFVISKK
jgi:hypothetical protein